VSAQGRWCFFRDESGELRSFDPSEVSGEWHASGTINLEDGTALQEVLSRTKSGVWIRRFEGFGGIDGSLVEARILTDLEALCWFVSENLPFPESLEEAAIASMVRPAHDAQTSDRIRRQRLAALPTAIVCAYALRDLYSICYEYPSTLAQSEMKSLRNGLWSYFWNCLQSAAVDCVTEKIMCPFVGTREARSTLALYAGTLLTIHPEAVIEPSGVMSNGAEILQSSLLSAPPMVREAVERIHEIAWSVCRWPDQPQEVAFASESRRLHLAQCYWGRVALIIGIESSPNRLVGWRPHRLLPLVENLRLRVDACLRPLELEGDAADARTRIDAIIDVLLTDPEALDIDEFVSEELGAIEGYFVRARLNGRITKHALTRAEQIFLQSADPMIDEYKSDFDTAQVNFKKRVEAFAAKRQKETRGAVVVPRSDSPPTSALPPMSDEDVRILRSLLNKHPKLCTQHELEAETEVSRKTVGARLSRLRDLGLVHRPSGARGGDLLTEEGVAFARTLSTHK